MLKRAVFLSVIIIMLISIKRDTVLASEQSSVPELQLEYVDSSGWSSECVNVKIPMTEEELTNVNQMLVYYSFDGENYQSVIHPRMDEPWDLLVYEFGEIDENVYMNECMNPATTPLKQFLSGEVDSFWVKIHIVTDTYSQYTTAAKLERNTESIALPDYCTAEASYPRNIIEMFRDENGQFQTVASQRVEIPQGTTREQILKVLPDSYDMEVIIIEDGYNLLGEFSISYSINWNIPENLETLVPGEYTVKVDNTVTPPAEKQIFKKGLQQYYFTAPSTDIPLHLVLTVTEADADAQSPPPSDQEETDGADDSYGSGGNRGDVGNGDISQEKPQPELPSESPSESQSGTPPKSQQESSEKRKSESSTKSQQEFQSESRQKSNSNPDSKITGSNATDQSALQSDLEEAMPEKSLELGNAQKDVTSYRNNHTSLKYIGLICVISFAVSAGIAVFIYWRKSNPKV